jgi:hypothetical protein
MSPVRNNYVRILTMGARFDHDNTSQAQHDQSWPRPQDSESKLSLRKYPKLGKSSRKIRGNKTRKFLPRNYSSGTIFFPAVATKRLPVRAARRGGSHSGLAPMRTAGPRGKRATEPLSLSGRLFMAPGRLKCDRGHEDWKSLCLTRNLPAIMPRFPRYLLGWLQIGQVSSLSAWPISIC